MRGSWSFKKHIMKVLKWTIDFTADHEPPVSPVSVSFNHLPIHLFQKGPLMSLTALIGRPLVIDAVTRSLSRPSVARVCIEVNFLRNLPKRVWIGNGESGFWQAVTYEKLPHIVLSAFVLDMNRATAIVQPQLQKHNLLNN